MKESTLPANPPQMDKLEQTFQRQADRKLGTQDDGKSRFVVTIRDRLYGRLPAINILPHDDARAAARAALENLDNTVEDFRRCGRHLAMELAEVRERNEMDEAAKRVIPGLRVESAYAAFDVGRPRWHHWKCKPAGEDAIAPPAFCVDRQAKDKPEFQQAFYLRLARQCLRLAFGKNIRGWMLFRHGDRSHLYALVETPLAERPRLLARRKVVTALLEKHEADIATAVEAELAK